MLYLCVQFTAQNGHIKHISYKFTDFLNKIIVNLYDIILPFENFP